LYVCIWFDCFVLYDHDEKIATVEALAVNHWVAYELLQMVVCAKLTRNMSNNL